MKPASESPPSTATTPASGAAPALVSSGRAAAVAPITLRWPKASRTQSTAAAVVEERGDPGLAGQRARRRRRAPTARRRANWSAAIVLPSVLAPPILGATTSRRALLLQRRRAAARRQPASLPSVTSTADLAARQRRRGLGDQAERRRRRQVVARRARRRDRLGLPGHAQRRGDALAELGRRSGRRWPSMRLRIASGLDLAELEREGADDVALLRRRHRAPEQPRLASSGRRSSPARYAQLRAGLARSGKRREAALGVLARAVRIERVRLVGDAALAARPCACGRRAGSCASGSPARLIGISWKFGPPSRLSCVSR